ncbi:MAG TPA: hypothetical protein VLJ76_10720 [Gaiellaceae bacterium]|nr:hypothetical protein [Gaiellaceae bacterium]
MRSLIPAGACTLLVCALAACGGGGGKSTPKAQTINGASFRFQAPGDWHVVHRNGVASASPSPTSPELVSVSITRTLKNYEPSLFTKAIPELDSLAADYARRLGGGVDTSSTIKILGQPFRQYTLHYGNPGKELSERITFVFNLRTEYQLLCQWKSSDQEPSACAQLTSTFTRT